jgi:hypothetical protein
MALSDHFWQGVKNYVVEGSRVAELYHGENDDILKGLAGIVLDEGVVFGVDALNPFRGFKNMAKLQEMSNVKLLKFSIPPFPSEVSNLDAILIRGFFWTYCHQYHDYDNPQVYECIDKALNDGGHLILHLDRSEQKNERGKNPEYKTTILEQFSNFTKVYDFKDLLVYQKINSVK